MHRPDLLSSGLPPAYKTKDVPANLNFTDNYDVAKIKVKYKMSHTTKTSILIVQFHLLHE